MALSCQAKLRDPSIEDKTVLFSSRKCSNLTKKVRKAIYPQLGLRRAARYHLHRLSRISATPHSIALGFATGTFISFTPLVGFHLLLAAAIAFLLRGNIVASAVGTLVGNPLTFPFIWLATYNLGAALLGERLRSEVEIAGFNGGDLLATSDPLTWFERLRESLSPVFWPMMAGGVPLGILAGAICYWIVRFSTRTLQSQRKRRATIGEHVEPGREIVGG